MEALKAFQRKGKAPPVGYRPYLWCMSFEKCLRLLDGDSMELSHSQVLGTDFGLFISRRQERLGVP